MHGTANLDGVRKVVEGVLVNEWHKADHEGHRAVPPHQVGITAVTQQHVQELVSEGGGERGELLLCQGVLAVKLHNINITIK